MPKLMQYRIVKLQVESFKPLGFETEFGIQGFENNFAPKICLKKGTKEYRFSENNWTTVSMQLAKLYKVLSASKNN